MKKAAFILFTGFTLLMVFSLTACKKQEPAPTTAPTATPVATVSPTQSPTPAPEQTPAPTEAAVQAAGFNSVYTGEILDTAGDKAGTAYFGIADDGTLCVALLDPDKDIHISAVGILEINDDETSAHITDAASGETVSFVIMPMDDESEDAYFIRFMDYDASGYLLPADPAVISDILK